MGTARTAPGTAAAWREGELQAAVEGVCRQLGLLYYHTHRSEHSTSGWPDIVIIAPGRGVVFWELKRERTYPTPAQQAFLIALQSVGLEVAVRRPSDYLEGRIVTELQALARRPMSAAGADLAREYVEAHTAAARAAYLGAKTPAGRFGGGGESNVGRRRPSEPGPGTNQRWDSPAPAAEADEVCGQVAVLYHPQDLNRIPIGTVRCTQPAGHGDKHTGPADWTYDAGA